MNEGSGWRITLSESLAAKRLLCLIGVSGTNRQLIGFSIGDLRWGMIDGDRSWDLGPAVALCRSTGRRCAAAYSQLLELDPTTQIPTSQHKHCIVWIDAGDCRNQLFWVDRPSECAKVMGKKARDIGGKIQALGLKIVSGSVLPIGKVTGEEKNSGQQAVLESLSRARFD